jgi:hypothetical protein
MHNQNACMGTIVIFGILRMLPLLLLLLLLMLVVCYNGFVFRHISKKKICKDVKTCVGTSVGGFMYWRPPFCIPCGLLPTNDDVYYFEVLRMSQDQK